IMNGTNERLVLQNDTMSTTNYFQTYEGLIKYIEMQQSDDAGAVANRWSGRFFSRVVCPECKGDRLNREALHFFVDGMNIAQLARLDIGKLYEWSSTVSQRLE
ncbi:MAG: excinuclease ABC subunit UvrA, partial [Muribaculaceae bacterium]|nr:excinuclease ABC subunit UvrA [Muribaculaceae bacterium]